MFRTDADRYRFSGNIREYAYYDIRILFRYTPCELVYKLQLKTSVSTISITVLRPIILGFYRFAIWALA